MKYAFLKAKNAEFTNSISKKEASSAWILGVMLGIAKSLLEMVQVSFKIKEMQVM